MGDGRGRALLRSLAIQGSWNYRTLLGAGFAFALVPLLRGIHGRDPDRIARALGRHAGFFNAHPYMANVALGAVARLERDGAEPEVIERLKVALTGPLGTLGDRLVWARWRPLCVFITLLMFLLGAPWWAALAAFLVLYNVVHVGLRVWGFHVGWNQGLDVGRALLGSPLRRVPDRLTIPVGAAGGTLLLLVPADLVSVSGIPMLPALLVAMSLGALGLWRPLVAMRAAWVMLLTAALVSIGLALTAA